MYFRVKKNRLRKIILNRYETFFMKIGLYKSLSDDASITVIFHRRNKGQLTISIF